MATIKIKSGTRAQLDAAALATGLLAREPYFISDEGIMAIGTGTSTYKDLGVVPASFTTGNLIKFSSKGQAVDASVAIDDNGTTTSALWTANKIQSIINALNAVPNTRTVNGHALTADVTVTASDVGLGNVTNESKATMFSSPTFTGTVAGVTATMVGLGNVTNDAQVKVSDVDTNTSLGTSDTKVPSQKAVKAYADALIAATGALVFKGVINASTNPNYPAATIGWTYKVSVAGKIGGASGLNVEVGDLILALETNAGGTEAAVGTKFAVVQTNLDGAVIGTASSVSGNIATFSGTSGKLIADGGILASNIVTLAGTQELTNKTVVGFKIQQTGTDAEENPVTTYLEVSPTSATGIIDFETKSTLTDAGINFISKGVGSINVNGYQVANISTNQLFQNKTLLLTKFRQSDKTNGINYLEIGSEGDVSGVFKFGLTSGQANAGINFTTKGTGTLQYNGTELLVNTRTVNGHALTSNVTVTASDVGLGNVTNESKATMFSSPTFTGTVAGVTATMVGLGNVTNDAQLKAADLDTTTTLGTSDTKIPSQKAVKSYVDTAVSVIDGGTFA